MSRGALVNLCKVRRELELTSPLRSTNRRPSKKGSSETPGVIFDRTPSGCQYLGLSLTHPFLQNEISPLFPTTP